MISFYFGRICDSYNMNMASCFEKIVFVNRDEITAVPVPKADF